MRGVSNFEEFKEFGNPAHPFTSQWYPNPKEQVTGALIDGVQTDSYNVFNFNPYVFFVHKTLGMNGYGFSVDDDTADVGALGSHLQIAFGSTAATPPGQSQKLVNLNYYRRGSLRHPQGGTVDKTSAFGALPKPGTVLRSRQRPSSRGWLPRRQRDRSVGFRQRR